MISYLLIVSIIANVVALIALTVVYKKLCFAEKVLSDLALQAKLNKAIEATDPILYGKDVKLADAHECSVSSNGIH